MNPDLQKPRLQFPSCLVKLHFNIVVPSTLISGKWFPFYSISVEHYSISYSHTRYMFRPCHLIFLSSLWRVQVYEMYKGKADPVFHWALCRDDVWGSGGIAPPFLTSTLVEGEWSASGPGRFTPGKGAPGTHCIGSWVGPRAGLDPGEKK
jgi:hypothetical protein